jgi:HD-like signal output (HDOD) protein
MTADTETKYEQETGKHILVVVNSAPIRSLLVRELQNRQVTATEAVSGADALRIMSREGVPKAFVVQERLGNHESGLGLVSGLSGLEKTRHMPAVVVVESDLALDELKKKTLPAHIVPVIKNGTLDAMVNQIVLAYEQASDIAPDADAATITEPASRSHIKKHEQMLAKLDTAFKFFTEVVLLVRKDKLPGPMMPQLLQKVRGLLSDPDVAFKTIADFVGEHQTLSMRLMALANSAYYSRGHKLKSIQQAISRLGLKKTGVLLQTLAAAAFVVGKDKMLQAMIVANLQKVYFVAIVCEELARINGHPKADEVYTVGLFHNIGATFLMYTFALLKEKGQVEHIDSEAIKTMVASRANALNRLVGKHMQLPSEIQLVFAAVSGPTGDEAAHTLTLVRQAIWIADHALGEDRQHIGFDSEAELLGVNPEALDVINEKLADLKGLLTIYT